MTHCIAIAVDRGLVFTSDSRTNAGADQVSTYSKMHTFCGDGERIFVLLTSGNLATTQAVVRQLRRDMAEPGTHGLKTVKHLSEAADYVGDISRKTQQRHKGASNDDFSPEASFILGGQIKGQPPQIYLIYPEGNHIRAAARQRFLQIGESKYGKPILDRIIRPGLSLEDAARCSLVSMDSTMRSNVTVGPPIEVRIYHADSMTSGEHIVFEEDHDYLRILRSSWQEALQSAFDALPGLPGRTRDNVRPMNSPGNR